MTSLRGICSDNPYDIGRALSLAKSVHIHHLLRNAPVAIISGIIAVFREYGQPTGRYVGHIVCSKA